MSEAAHIPFTETKAPESAERLHRGALGLVDISASTMANIGPAYSFYFGFAGIVALVGVASPLVLVVAIIAIALLGNTLSQFSRAHPSTGGFITFVGKTFGGTSAVTTALLCGAGYIIAIASVLVISGGFLSMMIQYYLNVSIPWIIFSAAFTAGAMVMPDEFNVVKHIILPVLGMAAIAVPLYYLSKPGQSQPYSWFPYAALGVLVVSTLYSMWLVRRDPGLGERVGSIVADE